jgi:hypothetical protein
MALAEEHAIAFELAQLLAGERVGFLALQSLPDVLPAGDAVQAPARASGCASGQACPCVSRQVVAGKPGARIPRPFAGALCHFLPSREWAQGPFLGLRWKSVARHSEEHFGPDGASGDDMLLPQHAPAFAELFGRAYAKNIR